MRMRTKLWLITAASLVLIGCMILGGAMAMFKWDFTKLSTNKYETNNYEINDSYKNIAILTDTADITFVPCEDAKTSVVCYEQENCKHSVSVNDSTLVIKLVDTRKWYEYIGVFNFETPKITVYIPQGEYSELLLKSSTGDVQISKDLTFKNIDVSVSTGDVKVGASVAELLKVKTSTGNISAESLSAGEIDFSVTTGKVTASGVTCNGGIKIGVSTGKAYLTDIACKSITSSGSTGDIFLKNVIVSEKLSVERSTGDVTFDSCDAAELSVKTDTGNVKGTLLTEKIFFAESDTGSINLPKSMSGGRCEIRTDTGNIKIEIQK